MRILYPFPEPLPLPKARAIQVIQTVKALAAAGAEVVLAHVPVPGVADPFAHYGETRPRSVHLLPLSRRLPGLLARVGVSSNKLFLLRLRHWLNKQGADGRYPDAIFVRHLKLARGLIGERPPAPVIYEAHELFADTAPPGKQARLAGIESEVLAGADGCIAISSALRGLLQRRYGETLAIDVIPSAANVPDRPPVKRWEALQHSIIYAGGLYAWKGVDDLVAAAAQLPGCTVRIIGGTPEEIARLRGRVAADGARVLFPGRLSHLETIAGIGASCIAILPNRAGSVSEFTSPLKLFEYMAAGCALVASDLPTFREILGEDEAAWFPAGNPQALAAALQKLLHTPAASRRMGEHLHARAGEFSWDARARRILGCIANARRRTRERTAETWRRQGAEQQ